MTVEQEPERRYALDIKIAVLEQKVDDVKEELDELKTNFGKHQTLEESKWELITVQLNEIKSGIGNSKSFVGGITFILGCLWAAASMFKDQLLGLLK